MRTAVVLVLLGVGWVSAAPAADSSTEDDAALLASLGVSEDELDKEGEAKPPAAATAAQPALDSFLQRRVTVLPEFADHPALSQLDLRFCGSGSESQISRGPLGCGFPIVGDHPWLVALGFRSDRGRITYGCSGVLISDQFVLTSARCALGSPGFSLYRVRLSEYDFSSRKDCQWYDKTVCLRARDVAMQDVLTHPNYTGRALTPDPYDLALVRLYRPVTLDFGLEPVCLPIFPEREPPHKQFSASFGLHAGPQPLPHPDDGSDPCCSCSRDRNATSHVMDHEPLVDFGTTYTGDESCRYELLEGTNAGRCVGAGEPCIADMGSPLLGVDRFGSAYYVLGVVSTRPEQRLCRQADAQTVFGSIQPHLRWILDTMHCSATRGKHCGTYDQA